MPNRLVGGPQSPSSDDLYSKIALDNKLITRYHLRQASKEQEDLAEGGQALSLGAVLVRMGFLTEGQHQSVINACRYREQRDYDKRFARQILRMELLEQSSIEESLEVQKKEYGQSGLVAPLADGLENAGKLSAEQVESVHKGIQERDQKGRGRGTQPSPLAVSGPTPVLGARSGEDDPTVEGAPLSKRAPKKDDLDDINLDDIDADLDDIDDEDLDDADLDDDDLDDDDLDDLDDDDLDDEDLSGLDDIDL
ncbi:MAG: hypothetical protein JKY65_08385, partial [Planctomycetes bacterium]|nr:hypothetical protein [Planctomycetota bacterium]